MKYVYCMLFIVCSLFGADQFGNPEPKDQVVGTLSYTKLVLPWLAKIVTSSDSLGTWKNVNGSELLDFVDEHGNSLGCTMRVKREDPKHLVMEALHTASQKAALIKQYAEKHEREEAIGHIKDQELTRMMGEYWT